VREPVGTGEIVTRKPTSVVEMLAAIEASASQIGNSEHIIAIATLFHPEAPFANKKISLSAGVGLLPPPNISMNI
jgi:hypothetical protein